MNTINRISKIVAIALFIIYCSSCQKTDDLAGPPQTIELKSQATQKADFIIKSSKITQTQTGYKFNGELLAQSSTGKAFGLGIGDFEIDTASNGSVAAIRGIGMAEFPDVGVFAEMLKTFTWEKIKAHIEYQTGQYYMDTYHTELPLTSDTWYLHFKPFDDTQGSFFELKQKLNSLVYHFADFYLDPLDPSIMMKADISMPEDPIYSNPPGLAGAFLTHFTNTLNDNNPIAFKAMIGLSNQGSFKSKAYDFPVIHKDFFRTKYGMSGFESSPSNYFVKMDEPGIPVPYTNGMLNIIGEEYLHQPAIITNLGDFSQGSLLDYLNNAYEGGYMMNFNGKLRFGGNKYFSELLNSLGTINDIVGKDVFNADINMELAQATLQIQFPGTVEDAGNVPSYFRFGGLTKAPLATDIFGEKIKKYIPVFPPPATQQFFYISAGPTKDDYSIYLEGGARVHVPSYGDLELGNAFFYVSLDGIEMGATSDIDVGPFHIDGDMAGTLSTTGFSLDMETSQDFTVMNDINLVSSHLKINASSDSGLTFHGSVKLPFDLGMADVKGKVTDGKTSFSGMLKAGTQLTLANGVKLPTADMKFTLDDSNGLFLEGRINVPYLGWASVKGRFTRDDIELVGKIKVGSVSFGSTSLAFQSDNQIIISKKKGVNFAAVFEMAPFGDALLVGDITSNSIKLEGSSDFSLPIAGHYFNFLKGKIVASNTGVTLSGNMDLYFAKMAVSGFYYGINNFKLSGSSDLEKGPLALSLGATITSSNIGLTGSATLAGEGIDITLKPDWDKRTLDVCYDVPVWGETCVTIP